MLIEDLNTIEYDKALKMQDTLATADRDGKG